MGNDDKIADVRVVINGGIIHDAITRTERLALEDVAMTMPINENKVVLHVV